MIRNVLMIFFTRHCYKFDKTKAVVLWEQGTKHKMIKISHDIIFCKERQNRHSFSQNDKQLTLWDINKNLWQSLRTFVP